MSKPQLMNVVDDGIIKGNFEMTRQQCENCGHYTRCLRIQEIKLPAFEPSNKLIAFTGDNVVHHIEFIGLGCGCYARFHRQIAHITSR